MLQRLSDQRRRLALAGLAAGALVAAVVRRKKGGGEAEFGEPTPVASTPVPVPVESGPSVEVEVPTGAGGSKVADDKPIVESGPRAADAPVIDPAAPSVQPGSPAEPEPPVPSAEPATGELSAEEASILAVLAQSGRLDDDRTAIAVATSLERETTDVAAVLRKLAAEGVVSGELYTSAGDKIWAVTERGVRRLGAQS